MAEIIRQAQRGQWLAENQEALQAYNLRMSFSSGFITATMLSISTRGVKYWPAPDFFSLAIFFQQAFVQVAQAFLAGAVPIEFVNFAHQRGKRSGFLDEAAGVGEDFPAPASSRGYPDESAVSCRTPADPVRRDFPDRSSDDFCELIFGAGFLGHLEEQQIGQLGDVLMVGDAVVLEDVAQVPEFADDVVGGHGLSVFMN